MPIPGDASIISARTAYPDSIVPGEDYTARMQLVRDGVPVVLSADGTVQLLDGRSVVASSAATLAGSNLDGAFPGATTAGFGIGKQYQVRWTPTLDGDTAPRSFHRRAVVSPIRLDPPISDADLTGVYPDLLDLLGGFRLSGANGEATLQPFIDDAWGWLVRKLLKVERWQDRLMTAHDAYEPVRERAWFRIFSFLLRSTGGDASRFEALMNRHRKASEAEWAQMSGEWDKDDDGIPDGDGRDPAQPVIHRNGAPQRYLSQRFRSW